MKILLSIGKKALRADSLLGVGSFEDSKDLLGNAGSLDNRTKDRVRKFLKDKKFTAKSGETLLVPGDPASIYVMGLGKKEKHTLQKARLAAARLICQTRNLRFEKARLDLESVAGNWDTDDVAGASVEGVRLADYEFKKYKSKKTPSRTVELLELSSVGSHNTASIKKAIHEAEIVTKAVYFTRDVANEPANVMTTVRLAQAAKSMALENNLICRVLGKNEIARLKMGGVLGVSQGSSLPPQFVILENKVKNSTTKRPIVLVGKGVVFDTGGISIKPANDMDKMKFDMCGAAAVMGAMKAIANLKLPIKVIGITPIVENMPGSKAQRPGDIITCMNGKTVEVLNTDAEGRLILADALVYAKRFNPRAIVDIATLTGACAATFHDLASGVMGTDPELVKKVIMAGERTGERCWELPLWEEYSNLIKATYADIQNISKKYAGTITAGMFLKEFADHTQSWAHLDIAGTAWNDGGAKALSPIGATGMGVRLFVRLVQSYL